MSSEGMKPVKPVHTYANSIK